VAWDGMLLASDLRKRWRWCYDTREAERRKTGTSGLCRGGTGHSNKDQYRRPAGVASARAGPGYDGAGAYDRGVKRPFQKVPPADNRKDALAPPLKCPSKAM